MSKLIVFFLILTIAFKFLVPAPVLAVNAKGCIGQDSRFVDSVSYPDTVNLLGPINVSLTFTKQVQYNNDYYIRITDEATFGSVNRASQAIRIDDNNPVRLGQPYQFTLNGFDIPGKYKVKLVSPGQSGTAIGEQEVCLLGQIQVVDDVMNNIQCQITAPSNIHNGDTPPITLTPGNAQGYRYRLYVIPKNIPINSGEILTDFSVIRDNDVLNQNGDVTSATTFNFPANVRTGKYNAVGLVLRNFGAFGVGGLRTKVCGIFPISDNSDATSTPITSSPVPPIATTSGAFINAAGIICDPDNPVDKNNNVIPGPGIYTAIGCIPTNPLVFAQKFLGVIIAAAGGLALLLMIMGAFKVITAQGNQDNVKAGREQFTAALIGLVFIIFSVLILRIIGVQIIGILILK